MYISKLSVRNFRNFRNVTLQFQKGVNTIIGENGSGKTNILHALRLLIDESMPRGIRFYESDFNRSVSWKGHWIIIQLEFEELDVSEEAQAIAMHKAGSMEEFDTTKGTYALFYRPREIKRRELYEYSQQKDKTSEGLQEILDSISLNDYELSYRGRGNTDFTIEENYLEYVGDFNNIVFPDPGDLQEDIYGTRLQGFSIPNELSCTFVKALRDVEADLRSYRDNPLLSLLRGKEKAIDIAKKTSIESQVESLNNEITGLTEVKDVSQGISKSIRQAVGETYAPNIEIKSEVPGEIEKLLQSLKLWVGDPDEIGYKGRIWELSLGGANLIYLSLKLLEYEKVKALNKVANFLLIEEPEAHIHTHIQKTLFQKLHSHNTQVIITTHSTHISSVSKISSINVLSRINKEAVVFNPSNGLTDPQVRALERYLDAVRTNLLFAKGVLLVEGDAEQILIPELVKKVLGVSLDEIGISLVNIGSTGFENIGILFHDNRVKKKCAIITDLDSSILPLPENEEDDTDEERGCRNSQASGILRKTNLTKFCNGNTWLESFYGKHTLEVDFVRAGNEYEMKETIAKAYTRKADINKSQALFDSDDVAVYGKEALRLANAFGKGWFAIMLAENVDHLTYIPVHILKAIAHASPHINPQTKLVLASYRLQSLHKKALKGDDFDYAKALTEMQAIDNAEEAIAYFTQAFPKDQLTSFLTYLNN